MCHLSCCPVFTDAISIPFSLVYTQYSVYIGNQKDPTRHKYFTLLIITYTTLLPVFGTVGLFSQFPVNRAFWIIQCQTSHRNCNCCWCKSYETYKYIACTKCSVKSLYHWLIIMHSFSIFNI